MHATRQLAELALLPLTTLFLLNSSGMAQSSSTNFHPAAPPSGHAQSAIAAANMVTIAGSWDIGDGIKTVYTVPNDRYLILTDSVIRVALQPSTIAPGRIWLYRDNLDVLAAPVGDLVGLRTGLSFPPGSAVKLEFDSGEGFYSLVGHLRGLPPSGPNPHPSNFVVVTDQRLITPGFPIGPDVDAYTVPPGKRLVITDRIVAEVLLVGSTSYFSIMAALLENGSYSFAAFPDVPMPRLVFQPNSVVGIGICCSSPTAQPFRFAFSGYLENL